MGTNAVNPENPLYYLIKRAQLYNPRGTLPQPQMPSQDQIPNVNPSGTGSPNELLFKTQDATQPIQPGQGPQPISPKDAALSEYRKFRQENQEPSKSDYHPSVLRQIIGGALGAGVGLTNPQAGGQLAHQIAYGPYDKSVSEYQRKVAQRKEAYETEQGIETQEAKLGEVGAQKSAEEARAKAEQAREEREKWTVSAPGQAAKLEQVKAAHPVKSKDIKIMTVNDKDDNPKNVYNDPETNQLMDYDTKKPLGPGDYEPGSLRAAGVPKDSTEKNRNQYNDFARGQLLKNPKMTDDEIAKAWKDYEAQENAKYEKAPQTLMISPGGVAQAVRPGTTVPEGSTNAGGLSSENVDTAPTRQMQETAPKVIDLVDRTTQLIDQQVKALGPSASRWSEFMAGKIGAPNREFTRLRTNAALLQTLLLRMHIGARGGDKIMAHFKDLIDTGKQSPENLKAALEEIKSYAQDIGKSSKRGGDSGAKKDSTTKPLTAEELRKKYGY